MPTPTLDHAADLHECHDCGLFQRLAPLRPGQVAACSRCHAVLRRRRRNSLSTVLALSFAGLALMVVAVGWPLLTFRLTGQERTANLLQLPVAFQEQRMGLLAVAVVATTVLAPATRLGSTLAVLLGLRYGMCRMWLARLARLRQWLRPWSMVEVFLLGVSVAYTRLVALSTVRVEVGLVALGGLMLLTVWADAWLDETAMWEAIGRRTPARRKAGAGPLLACDDCGLVSHDKEGEACARCNARLRRRKPQPVARAWALMLAASILYVPANVYPVLTVIRLGQGSPSTILGGVGELVEYKMYPLALLVLTASVLVPLLKLVSLTTLLISTQRHASGRLVERTRLYRVVDVIGRWSMIDVFMVSVLTALVRMGLIGSVTPGYGAVYFGSVVVLTMLAAQAFDPRVMWDVATASAERRAPAAPRAVPA